MGRKETREYGKAGTRRYANARRVRSSPTAAQRALRGALVRAGVFRAFTVGAVLGDDVVDFYCASAHLAVMVGDDFRRDDALRARGYTVWRVSDSSALDAPAELVADLVQSLDLRPHAHAHHTWPQVESPHGDPFAQWAPPFTVHP
ncbi:MAG: DUF559 domain-containing protein [Gemmatimonadaceae bacterium]|nr:DUF559 domain-containing protein [Gemmatimonadaceae bacterium]